MRGAEYLLAWPTGTTVSGQRVRIGEKAYALSDEVSVSGGSVQVRQTSGLSDLPTSCRTEEIFVVND